MDIARTLTGLESYGSFRPQSAAVDPALMAMDDRSLEFASRCMDALSTCAFVCDHRRRVHAMSRAAHAVVADNGALRLLAGRLVCSTVQDDRVLQALVLDTLGQKASEHGQAANGSLVSIRNQDGRLILLEAVAVASAYPGQASRFAMVIVRPPQDVEERARNIARLLFGLTKAEAGIAGHLAAGRPPASIAETTGMAVETVRTHIRSIYSKAGVANRVELLARVAERL